MGKQPNVTPPQPPKRALTSFFLYRAEVYDNVKRDNPDSRITEITKIIGEMWGNADKETKERLDKLYQKNKVRIGKEREVYEQKYGKIQSKGRKTKKAGKGK